MDLTKPAITLAGVPKKGCVGASGRLRVRVAESGGLARLVVRRGRKSLKLTRRGNTATLRARGLRTGRNRLVITATDRAGNRTTKRVKVVRC